MINITLRYKVLIFSFLLGFLLLAVSCNKLLEVDMPNDKIEAAAVYQDAATIQAALNSLYLDISLSSVLGTGNNGTSFNLSLFTDELEFFGTSTAPQDMFENTITDIHSYTTSWWNGTYQNIYAINSFIEGLSGSSVLDAKLKEQFLGEAYALRALYYHYLCMLYGDIPYTVSTDYVLNKTLKKLPYQEVLLKIESDLNDAVAILDYDYRDPNKFYINKSVALVLLLENYIAQKKYDKAEAVAQTILDQQLYHIDEDASRTFKKDAASTIWQIAPRFATNVTNEASLYLFSNFTQSSSVISTHLFNLFENQDKRKQAWLQEFYSGDQLYYQVYKYKNQSNNTDEFSIFYRIEQVYLQLAYSLFMQQKKDRGIQTLNILRQKRGLDALPETLEDEEFVSQYLAESSREFFTENGRRFIDLKNTGRLEDLKHVKPNFRLYHNLMPIPYRQIEINKNLLPNNPGY